MPPVPPDRRPPVPARFQVARRTLLIDRFMNQFINVGGVAVILAVFGIFVFILIQILPLFRGAEVEWLRTVELEPESYVAMGIDDWAELPFVVRSDGAVQFVDTVGDGSVTTLRPEVLAGHGFGAVSYSQKGQELIFGTADGRFSVVKVAYAPVFEAEGARSIQVSLQEGPLFPIGPAGHPVRSIDYADAGSGARKLAVALVDVNGRPEIHASTLVQRRGLIGGGQITLEKTYDLTGMIEGSVSRVLAPSTADSVVVTTNEGEVFYLFLDSGEFTLRQRFTPFDGATDSSLTLADFVFGDVTLVTASAAGEVRGFSLYTPPGGDVRQFGRTKDFGHLPLTPEVFASSTRNKAFVIAGQDFATLLFSTTETERWRATLPFAVERSVIGGKYDRILFLDEGGRMHLYRLNDPHPEAGVRTFFGKLWYEGQAGPSFDWQSTGGSDDFEPKLSLVPLIFGSLKGTFYAMVFAVPIALLAAIYTSQFLKPGIKTVVKPTMEIMASLPSVVLGFLAALWLAPLLDSRVPSLITLLIALPLTAAVFGWSWTQLPRRVRALVPPGSEFIVFVPIMLGVAWAAWVAGPWVERTFFTVVDPDTGARVADFRLWWPAVTGTPYEQRNSLIVGFMMGFAVIPIVFTIAEDALSNVPQSLRSGSLALGASRWQTAFHIVLPTAAAGIFSALMIGLGRAVGETMIVVMATGNTPIMEMNVFSGMRTLSANLAVELPEAPHHGTLYRSLFLGAMVLFLMTFCVNTLAEVLRQKLRDRYRTVE